MSTSVICKTLYVTPPPGQYVSEAGSAPVGQKACDQGQPISSEMNLLEMTDVEYTHLQHLIQSHMEAQDGAEGVRSNPASSADHESQAACPPGPSSSSSSSSSTLPTQSVSSDRGQEVLLYSDPSSISSLGEGTPAGSGEIPSSVAAMKMDEARTRNDRCRVVPPGLRPDPPARVCLEKRFNCHSCKLTKKHESQAAVLNTFFSVLQNSTCIPSIAMHSQPEKWPKVETSVAVECTRLYTVNQGVGHFSQLLEVSGHPEGVMSENSPVNKSTDSVPRSPPLVYTDTTDEQLINIENEVLGKAVKQVRIHRGRVLQTRNANIMPDSGRWNVTAGRKPGRKAPSPVEMNQRKEKHNLKERDRRRRIRLCCDELNTLVPFCYSETDKATTLQWTTAYLKYIREVYGDSLKQDFQNTFCGKSGFRIRPKCTNDVSARENSSSKE